MHPHLVIAGAEVELGEELGAVEFVEEFIHNWNGELVVDRARVQGPIVDAKAP
uniref:Uncharacterized protein n=1 Tax=Arundo donax TaxID=35708 RepID=A0A0A8YS60_ARUDO